MSVTENGLRDDRQQELAALMDEIAAGDRKAFAALYERTSAKLFATVRRILKNDAAAEDAVQEAYVRVWRRAADFDASIASPIAWMTTIARHVAIDMLRRGSERISAAGTELDAELAERIADPLARADRNEGVGHLADCIDRLESDRRGMVVLAYCYGWSREELARRYHRPTATVKTILRRSLLALKECLSDRG